MVGASDHQGLSGSHFNQPNYQVKLTIDALDTSSDDMDFSGHLNLSSIKVSQSIESLNKI